VTRGEGTYGVEVKGFTEIFTVNTQPEPEPEPEPEQKGVPGFPYVSVILGFVLARLLYLRNQS
jgi:hypothetical protein